MDGTILQQGRFTSDGTRSTIALRSDVDWLLVNNFTEQAAATASHGVSYFWQRGYAANNGTVTLRNAGATAVNITTSAALGVGGFTLVNEGSDALVGPAVAFSAITDATQPVVSTGATATLQAGDVVRLSQPLGSVDDPVLLGIDFQIDTIVLNTSFRIANALQQAPGNAGTNGSWRRVNVSSQFYPQTRYIVDITQAAQGVVTTSVDHRYVAGQKVRFHISSPQMNGMVELNDVIATIVATTASTFTIDVDTTAMTAFTFPTNVLFASFGRYTPAFVGPVGENTAFALANNLNDLSDATVNQSIIGIELAAGITSPAGTNGQVIYWVAGKSYLVDNNGDLIF